MAQTVAEIYNSLNPTYDPYRQLAQQQIDALPGQETAAIAAADTAKGNAFHDVTNQAVARGALYSGVPIDEENRYVGEQYAPKIAGIKTDTLNNRSKLQLGLLDVNKEQGMQAQSRHDTQVEADQRVAAQAAAQALEERRYQEQLRLAQTKAASVAAKTPKSDFKVSRDKGGGYQFAGPNGEPVTAAQYYAGTGRNWQDLANFIYSASSNDQLKKDMGVLTPQQLAQKYPYVFGGV